MQLQFSLRVDSSLLNKTRIIAEENSRSLNKEIEFVLKKHVADYEKTNGTIDLPAHDESTI